MHVTGIVIVRANWLFARVGSLEYIHIAMAEARVLLLAGPSSPYHVVLIVP